MDVTVIIGTFGEESWRLRGEAAMRRVSDSSTLLTLPLIVHRHQRTLAEARNMGADTFAGPASKWLCFVDADDDLDPGYFEAMGRAEAAAGGRGLLAPSVRFGADCDVVSLADRDIATINPCVIGTLIRRDLFHEVGGFWHEPAWEDWSLFRRAWLIGEPVVHVPDAVYRANSNSSGRNSNIARPKALHRDIILSHERWLTERRDLERSLA